MFQWDKKLEGLGVSASRVVKLHRSISEMHIGLPGIGAEEAFAYLCVLTHQQGYRVVVAFHLQQSGRVAFYLNDGGTLKESQAAKVLEEGVGFIESMGFLLSDLDIDLRTPVERDVLWDSLPLKHGDSSSRPEQSGSLPLVGQHTLDPGSPEEIPQTDPLETPAVKSSLVKRKTGDVHVLQARLRESLGRFLSSF